MDVNGTFVNAMLQSIVVGDEQVYSIEMSRVGSQIEAMTNLIEAIM